MSKPSTDSACSANLVSMASRLAGLRAENGRIAAFAIARFDHGAQYFTIRSKRFARAAEELEAEE